MSSNTSIEWTNMTWNPLVGCTRVTAGATTAMHSCCMIGVMLSISVMMVGGVQAAVPCLHNTLDRSQRFNFCQSG